MFVKPPRPSGTLVKEAEVVLPLAKSVVLDRLSTPVDRVKDLVSVCVTVPLDVVNERVKVAVRAKASPWPKPVASSKAPAAVRVRAEMVMSSSMCPSAGLYQSTRPGESGERPPSAYKAGRLPSLHLPETLMTLISKKLIDDTGSRLKLDALATALQAQTDDAEADPFDDAMLAATFALIELSKTHSDTFEQIRKTVSKLERRESRAGARSEKILVDQAPSRAGKRRTETT